MEVYYRHKAAGLCVSCGKPSMSGKVLCEKCREKNNSRVLERQRYLISKGICRQCGQANVLPGHIRCADCLKEEAKQKRMKNNVQV